MLKKININQLQKGMFICGTDRKWIDLPFLRTKFLVSSDKTVNTLQEYCQFVYIDTDKGCDAADQPVAEANPAELTLDSPAKSLYAQCHSLFAEVLNEVRMGQALNMVKIDKIVTDLLAGVTGDRQAMIDVIKPQQTGDALAHKSVNTCILALAFGEYLGASAPQLPVLGLGALLHDIGLLKVPDTILLKTEALTGDERGILEQHPQYGLELLNQGPAMPVEVLDIVAAHHEHLDGSGYPHQLSGVAISEFVRIVSLTSVYEALTGLRVFRETLSPAAALACLHCSGDAKCDKHLLASFMLMLGVYPLGCLVELQTGELAVVVQSNEHNPLFPLLKLMTNPVKQLLFAECLIDLADAKNQQVKIARILATDEPIVDLLNMLMQQEQATE